MDIPRGVGLTVTTTEAPPDEVPSRGATACTLTDSVYVNVVSEPSAGGTSSAAPTPMPTLPGDSTYGVSQAINVDEK